MRYFLILIFAVILQSAAMAQEFGGGGRFGDPNGGNSAAVASQAQSASGWTRDASTSTTRLTNPLDNVGIGTAIPASVLQIKGAAPSVFITDTGTGGARVAFSKSGNNTELGGVLFNVSSNNAIEFETGGTNTGNRRMTIDGGGNVGIGTTITANQGTFIMNGNVGIGTWIPQKTLDIKTPGQISVKSGVVTDSLNNFTGGTTPLTISNNSAIVNIAASNVGIGSTAPGSTLDIQAGTNGVRILGTVSKFSKKSGANTVCNTTCGTSMCIFGEDTGVLGTLLDCADATADVCICAGP